jgi:aminopeptidase N
MRLCALLLWSFMLLNADAAPAIEPGVSRALAQWRAQHYRDVGYALRIQLAENSGVLTGHLAVSVTLPPKPVDLVLDWRGERFGNVKVNGKPTPVVVQEEHLIVPAQHLKRGRNVVDLEFEAPVAISGKAVTRYVDREDGAEYLYTLLVPSDASTLFPCFDQPDLKGRFSLEVDSPPSWKVIANAPVERQEPGKARFKQTEPISTYLFAFAAGPFEELRSAEDSVRLLVRRSRLAKAQEHADEVLRLNREATAYFARYFAHPFPFAKYDLVLLPEFPYGGMEHAGATFLNEERVLFPAPPSALDLLRRAQLIFHETSHQWFGDLVTMRWFDDLWLKEGFANFMAAKAVEALLPQFDAWTAFHALKISAVRTDATRGTTAIRYPLANLASAKSAYGAIVYSKGPAVLRQLEFFLGEDDFRKGVRAFARRHAYGAADWSDLVRAFERASGKKLARWADAWVQKRGAPTVRYRGGQLEQRDALGEGTVWPMKLRVWNTGATHEIFLERKSITIKPPKDSGLLFPNAGDFGYGRFLLDPVSAERALDPAFRAPGTLLQAQLAEALWESVRDAELAPQRFIEFALRGMAQTTDDIALASQLGRIEVAFRKYLTDAQRNAVAPALEKALLVDATASRGLLLRRAFYEVAWTLSGLEQLKEMLKDPKLASRDKFRIVQRLLVRGDAQAPSLLAAEAAADRSDDGRRYAYAAGAAAPEAAAKRAIYRAAVEDATLPESWAEAALGPLNAPEQAALTRPLLADALARLPELKRSRKIFFVNGWLAAFIGGQTGADALAEVERYLRESASDTDLRLKVLEAIDQLERTVKIRARFAVN